MFDNIEILLNYNYWANKKALKSIKELPGKNEKPQKILSHILLAEETWLQRVKRTVPKEQKFWEMLSLEDCEKLIEKNKNDWSGYLNGKEKAGAEERISYVNSKGTNYENSLKEILMHLINHSSYHRGQIAYIVRELDGTPALTNYIVFARE